MAALAAKKACVPLSQGVTLRGCVAVVVAHWAHCARRCHQANLLVKALEPAKVSRAPTTVEQLFADRERAKEYSRKKARQATAVRGPRSSWAGARL